MFSKLKNEAKEKLDSLNDEIAELKSTYGYKRFFEIGIIEDIRRVEKKVFTNKKNNWCCAVIIVGCLTATFFVSWQVFLTLLFTQIVLFGLTEIVTEGFFKRKFKIEKAEKENYKKLCLEYPLLVKEKTSDMELADEKAIHRKYIINRIESLQSKHYDQQTLLNTLNKEDMPNSEVLVWHNEHGDEIFDNDEEKEAHTLKNLEVNFESFINIPGYRISVPKDLLNTLIKEEKVMVKKWG